MRKLCSGRMSAVLVAQLALLLALASGAAADTATTNHIYITTANKDVSPYRPSGSAVTGIKFYNFDYSVYGTGIGAPIYTGAVGPNAYLIKADGGGTNELHISSDSAVETGNVTQVETTSNNPSGTLYVTNSGGRGFDNGIILALAVTGPVSDNFAVHVKSSGYTWTPAPPSAVTQQPPTPTVQNDNLAHVVGIDEVFTKSDLIYGPQTARPGTGQSGISLPIFIDETASPSTPAYLMFIDLYVGNLRPEVFPGSVDNGAAKVEFSFSGLDQPTRIAFNAYGWASESNQGDGISWTNAMTGTASTYYIKATPTDTVYPTGALSYSTPGPYKKGDQVTITAAFSEAMAAAPVPALTLSGADTGTFTMTPAGDGIHYTYLYTAGGGDGDVAVALSAGMDLDGNRATRTPADGGTFTLDNTPPTVTFSAVGTVGNADVGTGAAIVATFSEAVNSAGITMTIDGLQGTLDIDDTTHTATLKAPLAPATNYHVTLSGVTDLAGNPLVATADHPTDWYFGTTGAADVISPWTNVTYTPAGPYKAGTVVTINATFSEVMAASPLPRIALSGAATLAPADTTLVDASHYNYLYTVGSGDGAVSITLSDGTDGAGNLVEAAPRTGGSFIIDNTPPTVAFTPDGSTPVGTGSTITATFSEPVDKTSVGAATFAGMAGSVTYDEASHAAVFVPAALAPGRSYSVSVSGVKDLAGNQMARASLNFTSAGVPDTTPPTASLTFAPAGSYRSGKVVTVTATFSEAMAASPAPALVLSGAASLPATDMTRVDATHYKYIYTVGEGDGVVNVSLANGTDIAGNPVTPQLTGGGSFILDNTSPAVTAVSPTDGATEVAVNSVLTASFSEAMDASSLTGSTFTVDGVSGLVTYDAKTHTATFKSTHELAHGATYTATLTTGARDTVGNPLVSKSWIFSTLSMYGDLKGTGEVPDVQDALMALRIAVGLDQATAAQMAVGDVAPLVNGRPHPDGKINISDALIILKRVVGLVQW